MSLFGEELFESPDLEESLAKVFNRSATEKEILYIQKQIEDQEKLDGKKYFVQPSKDNMHLGLYDIETRVWKRWLKQ